MLLASSSRRWSVAQQVCVLIQLVATFGAGFPRPVKLNFVALSDSAAIAELMPSIKSSSATWSFFKSGFIFARIVSSTRSVSRACIAIVPGQATHHIWS